MRSATEPVSREHRESLASKVLFSSLIPLVHLAFEQVKPLSELKRLLEMAYYREARRRRLTHREIADQMSVSTGKAALLSRQLKDFFFEAEASASLPRRVLALLWAGPLSETRLAQFLDDADAEQISSVLEDLSRQGLIEPVLGHRRVIRYRLSAPQFRQGHESWAAKLDGLNSFLRSVARLIEARFHKDDERSAVRTLSFHIRESDLPRLLELYEQELFPRVCALDEEADGRDDALAVQLAVHWVVGLEDD